MSPDPVVVHQEILDGRDYSASTSRPRHATAAITGRVIRDAACATMYEPTGSRHQ
jgi:hypothetical protein